MATTNTHASLVAVNTRWLQQALDLLGRLDHTRYTASPRGMAPHRVGSHLRHILEFYECFLDGLESTHVDYDARKRELPLEQNIPAAAARIREILIRLQTDSALGFDNVLFVKMEDSSHDLKDPFLMSSVGRELQTLSSHTIHHFALIGMTLQAHGFAVDPDFGMAPSTLRHRAMKAKAA